MRACVPIVMRRKDIHSCPAYAIRISVGTLPSAVEFAPTDPQFGNSSTWEPPSSPKGEDGIVPASSSGEGGANALRTVVPNPNWMSVSASPACEPSRPACDPWRR